MGGPIPEEALQGLDLGELARHMQLPDDPAQLRAAAQQMQQMFGGMMGGAEGFPGMPVARDGGQGGINWKLTHDLARRVMAGTAQVPGMPEPDGTAGDPAPTDAQIQALRDAANIAQMWLAPVIDVDVPHSQLGVWGRGAWLARTQEQWQQIVAPVAQYMSSAIGEALAAQLRQLNQFGEEGMQLPGDPAAMMEQVGGTMFAMQFGLAIGALARESVGTTDLGLPLAPEGAAALIAPNVEDLIAENDLEPGAARIFLASRELAHAALFQAAPWLPRALFSAIEDYARGITLDLDALDEMVRGLDMQDVAALQAKRPEDMFTFTRRQSQERALEELVTTLALIEGWVDHVTTRALSGRLPQLEALRELWRRRRVSGSPAEETLAKTVGIELRPRRAREALAWWESVEATEGAAGREAKWAHPDLLPSADVLSGSPRPPAKPAPAETEATAAMPETEAEFNAELEKLLRGEGDENAPREDEQGGLRGGPSAGDEQDGDDSEGPRA